MPPYPSRQRYPSLLRNGSPSTYRRRPLPFADELVSRVRRTHALRRRRFLTAAVQRAYDEYMFEKRALEMHARANGTRNQWYWVQWRRVRSLYTKWRRLEDSSISTPISFGDRRTRYRPSFGAPAA